MLPQVVGFQRGKAAHDDQMRDRVQQRGQGNSRHGDNSQRFSAKRHQRLDIRRQECALTVVAPARLGAKMQKRCYEASKKHSPRDFLFCQLIFCVFCAKTPQKKS